MGLTQTMKRSLFFSIFYISGLFLIYEIGIFNFASLSFIIILLFFSIYKPSKIIVVFFLYLPFYYILKDLSGYSEFIGKYNQMLMYLIKDIILFFLIFSFVVRMKNYRSKLKSILSNQYFKLYIVFLVVLLIISILNFQGLNTIIGLRSYVFGSLLVIFVYFMDINLKQIEFILKYTMFIAVIFSLVAIYQYYIDNDLFWEFFLNSKYASLSLIEVDQGKAAYRTISLIGHPNNLGLFLALGAIVSFAFSFIKRKNKLIYITFFIFCLIGVLSTETRMSLLALLMGILFFLDSRYKKKKFTKYFLIFLLILGLFIMSFSVFGERFLNIDFLTNPRWLAWAVVISDLQNPFTLLFGQGIGYHLNTGTLGTVDSSFWELLWEGGLVVFIIFNYFIYKILFNNIKHTEHNNLILIFKSLTVVLLMQMLTNSFLTGLFGYYLWLAVAVLIVLLKKEKLYECAKQS
jgi:hypothetical protein